MGFPVIPRCSAWATAKMRSGVALESKSSRSSNSKASGLQPPHCNVQHAQRPLLATGFKVPRKGVLLSLGPLTDKYLFVDEARVLAQAIGHGRYRAGLVDLVINIPIEYDELGRPDGYHIRRRAVDAGIPLITDLQRAQAIIEALRHRKVKNLAILSWDEYAARRPVALK